jgi:hypothetical protein
VADDLKDTGNVQAVVLVREFADDDLQLHGPAVARRRFVGHGAFSFMRAGRDRLGSRLGIGSRGGESE